MPKNKKPNFVILGTAFFLVIFGLLMVTSAGTVTSQERFGQSFYFIKNQLLKGLIPGLILGFFAYLIPYSYWRKYAKYIFFVCLIIVALVYVPGIGMSLGGAKRWIHLGNINFQPSEFFKLGFIIYLAAFLEKKGDLIKHGGYGLLSFMVILLVLGLLIGLQPDIGTLGVFVITALAMYFLARAPLSHIFILSGVVFSVLFFLAKIFHHVSQRVQVLLDPKLDPKGIGYQIDQSLIALGSGGFWGRGLTQSKQKFLFLPQPAGDSIAAVIGEELGFIGMVVLSGLFVTFAVGGFKIARNAPDQFSRLLAAGITCLITVQAFINILAIIGMIPLTGITLPFVSYGGSSLVVSFVAVGILLNISKYNKNL